MKLIQSFVGLNNDWITQFSSVLIADTIHTFFVIVDALIQAYRKLAKMAKHRLMFDFMNHKGPVFFCRNGSLVDTAKVTGNPIASVDHPLVVGNCWTEEDV